MLDLFLFATDPITHDDLLSAMTTFALLDDEYGADMVAALMPAYLVMIENAAIEGELDNPITLTTGYADVRDWYRFAYFNAHLARRVKRHEAEKMDEDIWPADTLKACDFIVPRELVLRVGRAQGHRDRLVLQSMREAHQ